MKIHTTEYHDEPLYTKARALPTQIFHENSSRAAVRAGERSEWENINLGERIGSLLNFRFSRTHACCVISTYQLQTIPTWFEVVTTFRRAVWILNRTACAWLCMVIGLIELLMGWWVLRWLKLIGLPFGNQMTRGTLNSWTLLPPLVWMLGKPVGGLSIEISNNCSSQLTTFSL